MISESVVQNHFGGKCFPVVETLVEINVSG